MKNDSLAEQKCPYCGCEFLTDVDWAGPGVLTDERLTFLKIWSETCTYLISLGESNVLADKEMSVHILELESAKRIAMDNLPEAFRILGEIQDFLTTMAELDTSELD